MMVCAKCGKPGRGPELTKCEACNKHFCNEHIYAGDHIHKHLCSSCLTQNIENLRLIHVKAGKFGPDIKEPYQASELQVQNPEQDIKPIEKSSLESIVTSKANNEEIAIPNELERKHIENIKDISDKIKNYTPKWQYKTIFLAIPSQLNTEYAVFHPKEDGEDFINQYKIEATNPEYIEIDELNSLGEEGWEAVCEIPQTNTLFMRHNNDKYFSLAGGIVTGVHLLLKREILN